MKFYSDFGSDQTYFVDVLYMCVCVRKGKRKHQTLSLIHVCLHNLAYQNRIITPSFRPRIMNLPEQNDTHTHTNNFIGTHLQSFVCIWRRRLLVCIPLQKLYVYTVSFLCIFYECVAYSSKIYKLIRRLNHNYSHKFWMNMIYTCEYTKKEWNILVISTFFLRFCSVLHLVCSFVYLFVCLFNY